MSKFDFYIAIELDDFTLYYTTAAEGNNVRSVAGVYEYFEPRLQMGQINQRLQDPTVARELPKTVNVSVDNGEGQIDQFHGFGAFAQIWDNRQITIKTGGDDGDTWASMRTEFVGNIKRGTFIADRERIAFQAYDKRAKHDRPMLTNQIDIGTYPNAEDKSRGRYIPIIYGDFTVGSAPAGGGRLPAFCIDTTTNAEVFKVAGHAIASLSVYKNGTLLTDPTDYAADLPNGQFTFAAAQSYDPSSDIVTADCTSESVTGDITSNVGPLENATDIIYDLIVSHTGGTATAADIDTASFTATNSASDQHNNRRWIGEQISVFDLIGELVFENNFKFYVKNDDYTMRFNVPQNFTVMNIGDSEPVRETVKALYDPDGIFRNETLSFYNPNVTETDGAAYRDAKTLTNTSSVAAYGDTVARELYFNWLYVTSNVSLQSERKLLVWSSTSHVVDVKLIQDGTPNAGGYPWNLGIGDSFTLTSWQYSGAQLDIIEIKKDGQSGAVQIKALAVADSYPLAQWSAAPQPSDVLRPAKWSTDASNLSTPSGRWF